MAYDERTATFVQSLVAIYEAEKKMQEVADLLAIMGRTFEISKDAMDMVDKIEILRMNLVKKIDEYKEA